MKKSTIAMMLAFALSISGIYVTAQNTSGQQQQQDTPPAGGRGPGNRNANTRPPRPPLEVALDTDGDGIISAAEIANASAALKKLDKNNDGQLTPEEYRPRRPGSGGPGGRGEPDGQAGPNGGRPPGGPGAPGEPNDYAFGGHPGHRPPPPGFDGDNGALLPPPFGRAPSDQ